MPFIDVEMSVTLEVPEELRERLEGGEEEAFDDLTDELRRKVGAKRVVIHDVDDELVS